MWEILFYVFYMVESRAAIIVSKEGLATFLFKVFMNQHNVIQ